MGRAVLVIRFGLTPGVIVSPGSLAGGIGIGGREIAARTQVAGAPVDAPAKCRILFPRKGLGACLA